MTIKTKRSIGDTIIVDGEPRVILAIYAYVSDKTQKERYYIGNQEWYSGDKDYLNKPSK